MHKKYGVLIVSYDDPLYRAFDSIRATQLFAENVPFLFIYNGPGPGRFTDRDLKPWECYFTDNNMNPTMYNKFIVVSKIILEHPLWKQLDYIIRINSSTFLNCKELPKIFKQLPSKNCYGGRPLETFPYTPAPDPVKSFSPAGVSGMYTFFTPDSLLKLVEKGITNSGNNDDVVLGRTMFELGVPRTLINDYLCNIDDLNNLDDTTKYEKALESTFIRIKNQTNRHSFDIKHWSSLYKHYTKKYV